MLAAPQADSRLKHGMYATVEYRAWQKMKDRCLNPKSQRFDRYGQRGISVCREWVDSFDAFFRDIGPRPSPQHSLERLDNNGNYEPGNVEWATRERQDNNKSTNKILSLNGVSRTLAQWAREAGIPTRTLCARIQNGWTVDRALTTPVSKRVWVSSPGRRWMNHELANAIRDQFSAGRSKAAIARDFGVSESLVLKIVRNELWAAPSRPQRQGGGA